MAKIAFLGMGVMGYPMAGHIAAAGHDVTVYNRTTAKAKHGQHSMGVGMPQPRRPQQAGLISYFAVSVMIRMYCRSRLAMTGRFRQCNRVLSLSITARCQLMWHDSSMRLDLRLA